MVSAKFRSLSFTEKGDDVTKSRGVHKAHFWLMRETQDLNISTEPLIQLTAVFKHRCDYIRRYCFEPLFA